MLVSWISSASVRVLERKYMVLSVVSVNYQLLDDILGGCFTAKDSKRHGGYEYITSDATMASIK